MGVGKAATASPGQAAMAHHASPHSHEPALSFSLWARGHTSASDVCAAAGVKLYLTTDGDAGSWEGA